MQKSTKTKFVNTATETLQERLAKEGVIIRPQNLEGTVLEIGELYYDMKRKEDLI